MTEQNIVKVQPKYVKKYKCPYCDKRYDRVKLISHIEKNHEDMIPKDYTATRVVFNLINKKTVGHCVICGKETKWDEEKARYERLCGNPACKKKYMEETAKRLYLKHGKTKEDFLNDPNFQKKMLEHRSISGKYKFQDGGILPYVGSYEKTFLEFMDQFFNVKSDDLIAPGPVIDYEFNGKTHQWITDFYYEPYNLVFDIKDGGDNPNTRDMKEYRDKQVAKEKAIAKMGEYNYIRLTDNKMEQMIELMMELKESLQESPSNNLRRKVVIRINESTERKRSELDDSEFGIPSQRKYPLDSEAHVRSAIKFFNYVDEEHEEELAKNIIKAMKKYNIDDINISDKNRLSKYIKKKSVKESATIKDIYSESYSLDIDKNEYKDSYEFFNSYLLKEERINTEEVCWDSSMYSESVEDALMEKTSDLHTGDYYVYTDLGCGKTRYIGTINTIVTHEDMDLTISYQWTDKINRVKEIFEDCAAMVGTGNNFFVNGEMMHRTFEKEEKDFIEANIFKDFYKIKNKNNNNKVIEQVDSYISALTPNSKSMNTLSESTEDQNELIVDRLKQLQEITRSIK